MWYNVQPVGEAVTDTPARRGGTMAEEEVSLVEQFRGTLYGHLLDANTVEQIDGGIRVGPYEVLPGMTVGKPVIRDAAAKGLVKGSGKYPRKTAIEPVATPAVTAYREKKEYREAFEELFPAGGDVEQKGSLAYAFDQFWQACEGSPQAVPCPHPEWHEEHRGTPVNHIVAFKKDAGALFKMIELGVGKAAQTVNVNSHEEKLIKILEARVVDVRLQGISLDEIDRRRDLIESYGYTIEGELADDSGSGQDHPASLEAASTASETGDPGGSPAGDADRTGRPGRVYGW